MRIELGAHVRSFDDADIGRIDKLIVEPGSGKLLGAVVRQGFILPHDVFLPIDWLQPSDGDAVICMRTADQVRELVAFDESHFRSAGPGSPDESILYPTAYPVELPVPAEVVEATEGPDPTPEPRDGVIVDEHVDVVDETGERVGELRGIIVDPVTGQPDRILVEGEGALPEDVEVGSTHVSAFDDTGIQLDVPEEELEDGVA